MNHSYSIRMYNELFLSVNKAAVNFGKIKQNKKIQFVFHINSYTNYVDE